MATGITRKQYRDWGARYGSGAVSQEARGTEQRWREDIDVLRLYGYTQTKLNAFSGLIADHDALRAARPGAVATKLSAVGGAATLHREARIWRDRAASVLGALGRTVDSVAEEVQAIESRGADDFDAGVAAYVALLKTHRGAIEPDVEPDALIVQGEALIPRLQALNPQKSSAKAATVADTEEIDVMDGRLLEIIADLNDAARKAFRARSNRAKVETYKYHYLRGKPSDTSPDAPPDSGPAHA